MRVYEKNDFKREDFENLKKLLSDETVSSEYRKTVIALLKAYCKNLYCSECQALVRTSSTDGKCRWNDGMLVFLPMNDGPLMRHPSYCPIRQLLKR